MKNPNKTILLLYVTCYFLILPDSHLFAQETNLKILDDWVGWSNGENMLQLYLNQKAYDLLDKREQQVSLLKTKEDWQTRQQEVKEILRKIIGQFPEKTPLNPQVTGIIEREGFRVEKILFESQPGFHVTGCLFIPEGGSGKKPGILNVIGHSTESFRRDVYQNLILNLVNKGFIVFAIDPVGQGERLQYYDPGLKHSSVGRSTAEHSYFTNQCLLAGYSSAKYFIWDGIRAIDYLVDRQEVDPHRIGLTGLSGGGTQTAFIGVFDERVKAAAPACYITSYRRLLESIGPQDGEQNFYLGLASGIDHADLLEARAPKPNLIVSTTMDFFSIQGARETYEEVKKTYYAFGEEEKISMAEADFRHGHVKENNEAVYAFFQKELSLPGDPKEENIEIFAQNELNVTPTGQLSLYCSGKTVFDLNKAEVDDLSRQLEHSREYNPGHLEQVILKSKKLSGYMEPERAAEAVFRGRYQKSGYSVEMYALEGDTGYIIPLLLFIPDGLEVCPCVIYLHPEGKEKGMTPGGIIEKMIEQGMAVAAPDPLGTGETLSKRPYPGSHGYQAHLIGTSILGIQAGDISRVMNFLRDRHDVLKEEIRAVAFGELCPALLHAAAFNTSLKSIALVNAQISYANIAQTRLYKSSITFNWGVAGALTGYDLPDLAASIAPRRLMFIGLLDGEKKIASEELVSDQMDYPRSVFGKTDSSNLSIVPLPASGADDTVIGWLKKQ